VHFSCSYTDAQGLRVGLEVSGAADALSPAVAGEAAPFEAEDLAASFSNCLPAITARLIEAHQGVSLDLHAALFNLLWDRSKK
jgi:hypothetical protein